ncbi:SRPBCC family protein [Natronococcus occultus]|uniref:Polyketide cyclase/dehydrase and lipid transport protein n=1 Tax=Natronococcus occultus SP4 TaxID=694430 RepID=L0JX11_9EURY|nr:SRPBCC family protein [Natronococcus occultus]AGB37281.1 polyketide cyclase/dehydrase and lipid transport protein [Natronococcus occultus SP4]
MTRLQLAAGGRRLEASHVLSVPPEDVWDLLVDVRRWPEWSPIIRGVDATDGRVRTGTTGRIRVPGLWLPFAVTDRTDRRWTWRIAGVSATGHRVDELADDRCRVVFELPPTAVGYAPVCLRALERIESVLEDEPVR